MPLPALLSLPFLTPIATFFGGLIFARNTDKTTSTSKEIAQKQKETQLKIALTQIEGQAQLEKHRQIHQTELEISRQQFQAEVEINRQQFQERMVHLGFRQQLSLEQYRQEFQLRLKNLDYAHQQSIEKFRAEVSMAINQKNLDFQRWRFEQETVLQQQLAAYNRETQLIIAEEQRKTALALPEINQIVQNWPLRIFPSQIINAYKGDGPVPLRVIISPPEVEYDKNGNPTKFPKIEEFLASGLRKLLNKHYPFGDQSRPTQLLDGAWDSNRFHGGTSIMVLFGMLKSEPTLVLESNVVGNYLNLKVAYWGLGQNEKSHPFYEEIISKLPYKKILYEAAKARALKWKTEVKDKLSARGKTLEEINKRYAGEIIPNVAVGINAVNLALLEEEENLKCDGIEIPQPVYQINHEDWEVLYQVLVTAHCLLTGWMADIHHLVHHNMPPQLPVLLPDLLKNDELGLLPVSEIVTAIVDGYKNVFKALENEQPHWIPELTLDLAFGLARLKDKKFAKQQMIYSITVLLWAKGCKTLQVIDDFEQLKQILLSSDEAYFEKLERCLKALSKDKNIPEAERLLQTWFKLQIEGEIKRKRKGETLF